MLDVGQHGPIVTELRCARLVGGSGRPLSRSSPRAQASWRRSRWFSSASSRLRRLAISRRRRRESSLARCRVGIGVLGWGRLLVAESADLIGEVGLGVDPGA